MSYRCLIVDDEPLALDVLESYIAVVPNLELAGRCMNAFEALKQLQSTTVDIIFLDVQMPQLTGTELLRSIRNPPRVIFTTAHKEYAVEAFDLSAVDYLLKPVSLERFIKAINKIDGKTENVSASLTEQLNPAGQPFLYFKSDRKMVKVLLDEIVYIESLKDYIKIVRQSAAPLVILQSISVLEEMLPRNKFLRVHRSYIVSAGMVSSFTQENIEVSGYHIPVGRAYRHQLALLLKSG
jgi:DNA-binding LytR/AlgR family response regulator